MSVENPTNEITEPEVIIKQSKLQECVSNKIPKVTEDHPEMARKQAIAVAHSMCREKLGVEKVDIVRMIETEQIFDVKLLRLLETGQIFDVKLQKHILQKIKNSLTTEDLIEYGLLLRREGLNTADTAAYLPYKEGWVKKHINPLFNQVIKEEKIASKKSQELLQDIQEILGQFTILDLKKEQRTFTAYSSVEQIDSQGDILSIDGLVKNMPIFEQRGGPIMFSHTNRHVGKLLKWEKQNIDINGQSTAAILVEIEVFPHYIGDDLAWACVLHAKENNLSILSYGATPTSPPEKICDEVKCVRKYNDVQPYEISIVNSLQGIIGANQGAKIVSIGPMATTSKPTLHPMMGGKLAKAKKIGQIANDLDLLSFALDTCDLCKAEYDKMVQDGKTDHEAQILLLHELKKEMSTVTNQEEELEEQEEEQTPDQAPDQTPEVGLKDIAEMLQRLQAMISSLAEQAMPQEKAVEEPATPIIQPENLTKLIDEGIKKGLANLKPEDLIALAKQKGLDVISTPPPVASTHVSDRPAIPELKKQDQNLSDDDALDAMANPSGAQDITSRIQQRK